MSQEKLQREAQRWYQQGLDDFEAAQALLAVQKFPKLASMLNKLWRKV